jgi:hypothetical protein
MGEAPLPEGNRHSFKMSNWNVLLLGESELNFRRQLSRGLSISIEATKAP